MNRSAHTHYRKPAAESTASLPHALRVASDERQEEAMALAGRRAR